MVIVFTSNPFASRLERNFITPLSVDYLYKKNSLIVCGAIKINFYSPFYCYLNNLTPGSLVGAVVVLGAHMF